MKFLKAWLEQEHAGETEMSRLRGGATEGEDNNLSGRSSSSQEEIPRVHKPQHWTITHAHLANMGGVLYRSNFADAY